MAINVKRAEKMKSKSDSELAEMLKNPKALGLGAAAAEYELRRRARIK
jgi:hypothetical protein